MGLLRSFRGCLATSVVLCVVQTSFGQFRSVPEFVANGVLKDVNPMAPVEHVHCGLPEVVDAASTQSINFRPTILTQLYEKCQSDAYSLSKYRTADGTCNHVFNLGAAATPPRRLLPNAYQDGVDKPRQLDTRGNALPAATNVSRTVHTRDDVNQGFTIMLMQWGQFIDHDLTGFPITSEVNRFLRCCAEDGSVLNPLPSSDCFPIQLTSEDANGRFFGTCMEFARSVAARDQFNFKIYPREQVNSVTSFMDGSMVYGSSLYLQTLLRENLPGKGPGALMRVSPGDLLPENEEEEICIHGPGEHCFLAGDTRVNEQPGLATMHTVFVRLHNQLVRELKKVRQNQNDDEEIFQLARKIVVAIIQNVHYNEWLPIILGPRTMREFRLGVSGARSEYVPSVDPRITNAFSTAAFRFGHSLIPKKFVVDGIHIPLRDVFNRPSLLFQNFNEMLKALVSPALEQGAHTLDEHFTEEVTGHLFEPENNGNAPSRGLDLVALNIQRGRDHGLPPYNKFRKFCGLPPLEKFRGATGRLFSQVYDSVDDIDLFSGMMTEPTPNRQDRGLVGATLACLLGNQFHALRFGDRFFFTTDRDPEGFNNEQLAAIRNVTLAHLCCESKAVNEVQQNAFKIPGPENPTVQCTVLRPLFDTLIQTFNDLP